MLSSQCRAETTEILSDPQGRKFRRTSKLLGRGTFAEVFLGEWLNPPPADEPTNSTTPTITTTTTPPQQQPPPILVAIKQFFLNRQTLDKALQTEIEIMRHMNHPNIVQLISVIFIRQSDNDDDDDDDNNQGDRLWVILEWCGGGDFRTFLKDKKTGLSKRLSEKWACKYMLQIVSGLKYLRERNIIHRDLKPHNLLLSKDRKTLKIADFGFARIVGSEALAATMCGSPLYMAPEVLRGDEYNSKADLWSVGIILYEMLCSERPFRDVQHIVALQQKMEQEPIMFPRRIQISRECRSLLQALLVKDPRRRIGWDQFFDHEWLHTDWDDLSVSSSTSITIPAPTKPSGIQTSKPISIPIPQQQQQPTSTQQQQRPIRQRSSSIRDGIVQNYMSHHLSSAPTGVVMNSPPLRSSTSIGNSTVGSSVFVQATTPYGGSDLPFARSESQPSGWKGTSPRAPQAKTAAAGAGEHSASLKQTLSDVFSTGFGLLKDSMKNNY